jgi:arsenate reductase
MNTETRGEPRKRRVLVLCTGNIARSQMVEGWWRHHGGNRWEVFSAGTRPGRRVHPLAVRVMAERGIDISGQRPKALDAFVTLPFDVVVTVCSSAERECPVFPNAARRDHWPMDDPVIAGEDPQQQLAVFRRLRDEADERIRSFLRVYER